MRRQFWMYVVVGVAVVAALVAGIVYIQRGAHLELKGAVLKVRTVATDEKSSVAVIDFRFANSADYPFVVRRVDVTMEDKQGGVAEGLVIAEMDAVRLLQYYTILGQKFNDSLLIRTRIKPHESMDRMVAVRFEIPEDKLLARKALRIRVEDVDGAVSEIVEGQR